MAQKKFKNKILNRIWELYPRFVVWDIWKTRNLKTFENMNHKMEEIWETLNAQIKETINLTSWSIEYIEADATKKQILKDWGINQ